MLTQLEGNEAVACDTYECNACRAGKRWVIICLTTQRREETPCPECGAITKSHDTEYLRGDTPLGKSLKAGAGPSQTELAPMKHRILVDYDSFK